MKTSILFLLPLASAAVVDKRQFGRALTSAFVEKLEPSITDRPGVVRQLVGFGPITLDAGKQSAAMYKITDGICKDCTVLKGKAGIRVKGEAAGTENKKVYIHHILTNEATKPVNPFLSGCSDSKTSPPDTRMASLGGSKFIGTGDDQASIYTYYMPRDVQLNTGYYVQNTYNFNMNAVLVNEENVKKEVYITMELEYMPGKIDGDTRDVLLMSGPCKAPMQVTTSEKEATSTSSGNYFFKEDGTIVYAKGHLHAGGEKMELYINGKFVCESKASYDNGPKGPITSMGVCPKSIPVKKGDYLSMKSFYDGSSHELRHGNGMMGGSTSAMGGSSGRPDVMGMWAIAFSNAVLPKV